MAFVLTPGERNEKAAPSDLMRQGAVQGAVKRRGPVAPDYDRGQWPVTVATAGGSFAITSADAGSAPSSRSLRRRRCSC